jgi:hypothetical protein
MNWFKRVWDWLAADNGLHSAPETSDFWDGFEDGVSFGRAQSYKEHYDEGFHDAHRDAYYEGYDAAEEILLNEMELLKFERNDLIERTVREVFKLSLARLPDDSYLKDDINNDPEGAEEQVQLVVGEVTKYLRWFEEDTKTLKVERVGR